MNGNQKFVCPACGKRERIKGLVCPNCYESYKKDAAKSLASGDLLLLSSWLRPRIKDLISAVEKEKEEKQKAYDKLKEEVSSVAFDEVKKATNGKFVEKEIFTSALEIKRKQIWGQKGGNKLFAELKSLETKVSFLFRVVDEMNSKNGDEKS